MSESKIRFAGELQRLTLQPGDKFVLTVDQHISADVAARIQDAWKSFAGDDVPLLVLDRGMKLGAMNVRVERADEPVRSEVA